MNMLLIMGVVLYWGAPTSLYAAVIKTTMQINAITISSQSTMFIEEDDDEWHVQMPEAMPYIIMGEDEDEDLSMTYSEDGFSINHAGKRVVGRVKTITIIY